jgi:hypothetical protein
MAMYVLTDHREERARAQTAQFRLLGALVAVTAFLMLGALGSKFSDTYRIVSVGLENALSHTQPLQ